MTWNPLSGHGLSSQARVFCFMQLCSGHGIGDLALQSKVLGHGIGDLALQSKVLGMGLET